MSKSPLITFKTFTKKIIKQKGKVINFGDRQCDTITHWERRVYTRRPEFLDNKSLTLFFEVNYRRFFKAATRLKIFDAQSRNQANNSAAAASRSDMIYSVVAYTDTLFEVANKKYTTLSLSRYSLF